MGERLLRRWLCQPLLSPVEINKRLDLVQLFVDETPTREELRSTCLKGIVDIDKLIRRLEQKIRFRLQDLYVLFQAVRKLEPILVVIIINDHCAELSKRVQSCVSVTPG